MSKVSSCESSSPLPQSLPDEFEVQTDFSLSTDEPFRISQSEQSLSATCTTDDDVSSNIDQVSTTETSRFQLHSDNESVYLPNESIAEPHTDWSCLTRKKIALLKSESDHDQTKL